MQGGLGNQAQHGVREAVQRRVKRWPRAVNVGSVALVRMPDPRKPLGVETNIVEEEPTNVEEEPTNEEDVRPKVVARRVAK